METQWKPSGILDIEQIYDNGILQNEQLYNNETSQ